MGGADGGIEPPRSPGPPGAGGAGGLLRASPDISERITIGICALDRKVRPHDAAYAVRYPYVHILYRTESAVRAPRNAAPPASRSPTQRSRVSPCTHVDDGRRTSKLSGLSRARQACALGVLSRSLPIPNPNAFPELLRRHCRETERRRDRLRGCIQRHLRVRCHYPRLIDSLPLGSVRRLGAARWDRSAWDAEMGCCGHLDRHILSP